LYSLTGGGGDAVVVLGLLFFESGRDAYARRAVWRHDGRVSESASERNAWRQSTEGAFIVVVAIRSEVVGMFYVDCCTLICSEQLELWYTFLIGTTVSEGSARGCHICSGPAYDSRGRSRILAYQPQLVTHLMFSIVSMRPRSTEIVQESVRR
jgi:hypothetical protein